MRGKDTENKVPLTDSKGTNVMWYALGKNKNIQIQCYSTLPPSGYWRTPGWFWTAPRILIAQLLSLLVLQCLSEEGVYAPEES